MSKKTIVKRTVDAGVGAAAKPALKQVNKLVTKKVAEILAKKEVETASKEAGKTLLNAASKALGFGEVAEFTNIPGLVYAIGDALVDEAREEDAELGVESAEQDKDNKDGYDLLKGDVDGEKKRTNAAVNEFDAKLKQAGYEENAPGAANLKTAAEQAIRATQSRKTSVFLLNDKLGLAGKERKRLAAAMAAATANVEFARSLPGGEHGHPASTVPGRERAAEESGPVQAAQQDLKDVQKEVDRNDQQISVLERKQAQADAEADAAVIQQAAAEAAALKNATGPVAPAAANPPAAPQGVSPAPPVLSANQAFLQLLQQSVGMHQTLGDLLAVSHKSKDEQLKIMQEIISQHVSLQDEVSRLRVQVANVQSVGYL